MKVREHNKQTNHKTYARDFLPDALFGLAELLPRTCSVRIHKLWREGMELPWDLLFLLHSHLADWCYLNAEPGPALPAQCGWSIGCSLPQGRIHLILFIVSLPSAHPQPAS